MEKKEVADYGLPPRETMILEEYREKHATYEKLLEVVKKILADSIAANNIYINAVEARIKAEDSLAGKLERKAGKYRSLMDLTDILGARVITFRLGKQHRQAQDARHPQLRLQLASLYMSRSQVALR